MAAMMEGILLPSNMAAETTILPACILAPDFVKYLLVTLKCAVNVTTSSFQHFPLSLVQNLYCVQKEVL